MERRAIIIAGPTCSGKTTLSLKLAGKLNTEIISADSRQIYKHLNIGTAKPDRSELRSVKHHFIDYLEPTEDYNVSRYEKEVLTIIRELHYEEKIPVIVGGSGLYLKAIIDGIVDEVDTDPDYRDELIAIKNNKGIEGLHELLKQVDPVSAGKMLPQNWKRIMRALEVYKLSGKFIWQLHAEQERDTNIEFIQFGLNWDRKVLYERINERVDEMIKNGLVDEVKGLIDSKYSPHLNSLNSVGYKEIISYLNEEISLERAVELIKRNTRRFAKRQMTWFRKSDEIEWIDIKSVDRLDNIADFIYNKCK